MSRTGLCQICEADVASHACDRCGRAVCDDHWDGAGHACTACVAGRR